MKKYSTSTSDLLLALNQVSGGIGRNQSVTYDKCLMKVKDGKAQLMTVSDVIDSVSREISMEGDDITILLEYAKLKQILTSLNRRKIEALDIHVSSNKITIIGGRSQYSVSTFNEKEFPKSFDFKAIAKAVVNRELFASLLATSKQTSAVNDARYYLNGVLFEVNSDVGDLRLVGTDGHRMSICRMDLKNYDTSAALPKQGFIIAERMVDELLAYSKNNHAEFIEIYFDDAHVHVQGSLGQSVTGRLIDGRYPDYRRVIPQSSNHDVMINREDLLLFLSSALPIQGTRFPVGKFVFENDTLTVVIKGDETEATASFDTCGYGQATKFEIGYNIKYIGDVLMNHDSEDILFLLVDSMSTTKIVNTENPNVLSVVMPVRI